ncbi:preprotein translocase subunit SecG [Pararhodospirillum photometricum]|uniref:Protein-export membrane protein SecG n=1 Tax=Pararhodospirillum photometricum DSM 122 TaxID=1150469 RepID=H6SPX7_PARPM|nr:preprotein translocase subunit SecG [Pararhodospirillum photometricum]CCG07247.1 Protein translocase subunit secG [Pararhodospirillum photometricum DSM 122]
MPLVKEGAPGYNDPARRAQIGAPPPAGFLSGPKFVTVRVPPPRGRTPKGHCTRMITVILVIHLIIAIAMVALILLQRAEGGALGIGGGGGGLMTGRQAGNLLTRLTGLLAAAFMITSLALAMLSGHHNKESGRSSVLDGAEVPMTPPATPALPAPPVATDAVPAPASPAPASETAAPQTAPSAPVSEAAPVAPATEAAPAPGSSGTPAPQGQ